MFRIFKTSYKMSDTKQEHIVHLSYTLARPAYHDPEAWLARVAFVSGVAEHMAQYARQTVIYNIHHKGEITRNGVRYLFPAFKRWQLVLPFAYNNYIKKLKPDVVLVHGLIFPWQIMMLRWLIGPKLKVICQHHAERPFEDSREYLFRLADRYIGAYLFASRSQGEEWVNEGQIASLSKVHEIMGTSSVFRAETKSDSPNKIYLWVGDLDVNKDPLTVIRAFRRFAAKHRNVALYMIFKGTELLEEVNLIMHEAIHLVGEVEHAKMQEWFTKAHYIISSSHYEGSGIAVCEALSCGCVPILTDIPSFRMMTDNGRLGELFTPGSEDSLEAALDDTFTIDYKSESEKVLQHFQKELSFEANARKIMDVIRNL